MKYIDYIKMQENDNPMKGEETLSLLSTGLKEEI